MCQLLEVIPFIKILESSTLGDKRYKLMWIDSIQGQDIKVLVTLIFRMHEFPLFGFLEAINVLMQKTSLLEDIIFRYETK